MVAWIEEGNRGKLYRDESFGASLWRMALPASGALLTYRRRKMWEKLASMGVRTGIFPPHLRQEAAAWGITPVEVAPLRRLLLEELFAQCAIVRTDTVALRSEEATPEVYEAAAFLSQKARYIVPEIAQGAEQLSDWLRREYGVCTGGKGRAVCGGVTFAGAPRCAEVHLGRDCRRYQTVRYTVDGAELPEELVSVLWQAGIVKREQIRIISVRGALDTEA